MTDAGAGWARYGRMCTVNVWTQHAADGAAHARVGRVQLRHLRALRPPRQPRLVPLLPLLARRLRRRDALRVQAAVPGSHFHEYCAEVDAQ